MGFSIIILLLTRSLLYKHPMRRHLRCTCERVCTEEEDYEKDKTLPLKHKPIGGELPDPSRPFASLYSHSHRPEELVHRHFFILLEYLFSRNVSLVQPDSSTFHLKLSGSA